MDQTTISLRNGTFLTPVIAFTMLVGVGTGGQYTPGYHTARADKCVFCKQHDGANVAQKSTIASELDYIKATLNLTMTELARCLGVSRQAIMAGGPLL